MLRSEPRRSADSPTNLTTSREFPYCENIQASGQWEPRRSTLPVNHEDNIAALGSMNINKISSGQQRRAVLSDHRIAEDSA